MAHSFEWKSGSETSYKLLAHAPFSPPEKACGNIQVEQPGYGSYAHGNGKGIVIPFTVGRGYHELGLGVYRDFSPKTLREEANVNERLTVDIAEQVEITVNESSAKTIVHLINMSGARKQDFGSHLPVAGGTISVTGRMVKARALKDDRELEVKHGKIMLPVLDLFEAIVIEEL